MIFNNREGCKLERELELTILMPCLNEAETLAVCIRKAKRFLEQEQIAGEVLIADNGSTDGSPEIAEANGARVIRVAERGYGSALRGGTDAAFGKYVIMGDADDSYDFLHLMPFVEKLREGYDLVMGNRFKGGIEKGAMPFLHRYLGNPVLSFLGRLLYRNRIGDFHCGLRGYNRASIQGLALKTTGMEYASEMVVMAAISGLKIAEVPTTLKPDGRSRRPHLRTFRDGWRHLKFLLVYCPRWLFLYPGVFLLALGLAGMLLLARQPVTVGTVTFDIHTLLYMAGFIIIGLQILFFMLLTDTYASRSGLPIVSAHQKKALDRITMEKCALAGLILLTAGIWLSVSSLHSWAAAAYGDLVPQETMRQVIPAWTLLIAGLQFIFNGFFLGILRF